MAVAVRQADGRLTSPDQLRNLWRTRIEQAREHRRAIEPIWLSNLAFAAGQHWLVWDKPSRQMRHISEVDPRYRDRELYTADKINEHIQAQLGELEPSEDRQELLLATEGDGAEQQQKALNDCVAYAWDYEWQAPSAIRQARRLCLKLGTAAIRVRFDPSRGPKIAHVPVDGDGRPVLDGESLAHLEQNGTLPDGTLPTFKPVHEGRTILEPLSAFHLLTPPGVTHEDNFPWEIVVKPTLIEKVQEEYGDVAANLVEDGDIGSMVGFTAGQSPQTGVPGQAKGRLRGHVWLYVCYERPCRSYPDGRTVVLASNSYQLLHVEESLPYRNVDGEPKSGIEYLHWWRLDDRFNSRSMIEPMKDPQRIINRRETQNLEIIDRGMPKAFVREGDLPHTPTGLPLEVVELKNDAKPPDYQAGIGPGQWMYEDLAHHADNLAHASTLSPLRLGENPQNIKTYSQLALLNENESSKRSVILAEHQQVFGRLIEYGVHDIRRYWPQQKTILVTGEDGGMRQTVFDKSNVPDFFIVRPASGSPKPRSQGAELTKIDAIWQAAVATGVVTGPNGAKWVEWYARSTEAGQALELPSDDENPQAELAHFENWLMVDQHQLPQPADHDLQPVHIPIHREALDRARASGDMETAGLIQQHIDQSIQKATTARKAWRFFDPADTNDTASDLALDEDQALRENEMLLAGQPINTEEYQNALASLQRGINPETGQPVQIDPKTGQPVDDLHGILERASLKPTLIENLQVHMDRHGKVIKSAEFLTYPEDARRRFLTHFDLTRKLWLSIPMMPDKIDSPHVTLNLRESVGASTIAKVLQRAGVPEADPTELAVDPPLENVVQATVNEPDPQQQQPAQKPATAKKK